MRSRPQRLKAIELTLTPQQVVVVWLRNALQGTFEDGARRTPPPRESVANAVRSAVRNSMKGQPELLVERAVLQARREADVLYNLVVGANVEVIETALQREREYILLLGFLSAEIRGKASKDRVEILRLAFLMVIEPVIILDAAITQVAAARLIGQPVLFRDTAAKLEEQLNYDFPQKRPPDDWSFLFCLVTEKRRPADILGKGLNITPAKLPTFIGSHGAAQCHLRLGIVCEALLTEGA
jgi:hypothetical protein